MKHKFVDKIPQSLENEVLYVSIEFGTAVHKCCCGCGNEVVTPLSPTDWKVIYDGETVSLYPSIGNWSLACRSHYWIDGGKVVWAEQWTDDEVELNRHSDRSAKREFYNSKKTGSDRFSSKSERWSPLKKWWPK
jgi:hypothetical protein